MPRPFLRAFLCPAAQWGERLWPMGDCLDVHEVYPNGSLIFISMRSSDFGEYLVYHSKSDLLVSGLLQHDWEHRGVVRDLFENTISHTSEASVENWLSTGCISIFVYPGYNGGNLVYVRSRDAESDMYSQYKVWARWPTLWWECSGLWPTYWRYSVWESASPSYSRISSSSADRTVPLAPSHTAGTTRSYRQSVRSHSRDRSRSRSSRHL